MEEVATMYSLLTKVRNNTQGIQDNGAILLDRATWDEVSDFVKEIEEAKIKAQNMCKIVGCDKAEYFKFEVPEDDLQAICQDIWDHPEKYGHNIGDTYYDFLKFLWVEYPDKSEKRLADLVE